MAWIWTQDKTSMVDVVCIQLSEPTASTPGPFWLIGICQNKQLYNLGVFSTKERALKEMANFGTWLRVDKGYGVFQVSQEN